MGRRRARRARTVRRAGRRHPRPPANASHGAAVRPGPVRGEAGRAGPRFQEAGRRREGTGRRSRALGFGPQGTAPYPSEPSETSPANAGSTCRFVNGSRAKGAGLLEDPHARRRTGKDQARERTRASLPRHRRGRHGCVGRLREDPARTRSNRRAGRAGCGAQPRGRPSSRRLRRSGSPRTLAPARTNAHGASDAASREQAAL
jgi:hypothetical protein